MEANKVIVDKKLARGVLIQDEKILLAKDIRTSQGHFFLPGGHVEPGESVVKTLEREWIEELGCHIHVGAFIGCVEHMWNYKKESDGELVEVFEINYLFKVTTSEINANIDPGSMEAHLKFFWISIHEISSINLLPATLKNLIPEIANSSDKAIWSSNL